MLLDAYFDNENLNSPRSNLRTVEYLKAITHAEGLDLDARRRNPTGQGIHNKMVLAQIGGQGLGRRRQPERRRGLGQAEPGDGAVVGSDEVYAYLADVFWYDWAVAP